MLWKETSSNFLSGSSCGFSCAWHIGQKLLTWTDYMIRISPWRDERVSWWRPQVQQTRYINTKCIAGQSERLDWSEIDWKSLDRNLCITLDWTVLYLLTGFYGQNCARSGQDWTGQERNLICINMYNNMYCAGLNHAWFTRPDWTELDMTGPHWTELDQTELNWTRLYWTGPDKTWLDNVEFSDSRLQFLLRGWGRPGPANGKIVH